MGRINDIMLGIVVSILFFSIALFFYFRSSTMRAIAPDTVIPEAVIYIDTPVYWNYQSAPWWNFYGGGGGGLPGWHHGGGHMPGGGFGGGHHGGGGGHGGH